MIARRHQLASSPERGHHAVHHRARMVFESAPSPRSRAKEIEGTPGGGEAEDISVLPGIR